MLDFAMHQYVKFIGFPSVHFLGVLQNQFHDLIL